MQFQPKNVALRDGTVCRLRSPAPADAQAMLDYLRLTSGETPYMIRFPDEVDLTAEQERAVLEDRLTAPRAGMIGAFIGGVLAANCGVDPVAERRKQRHRCEFGIAVKQAFWGRGIGGLLLDEALRWAGETGYEQLELSVFGENVRAQRLYRSRGFSEVGRVPRAFRLGEGVYDDEIIMIRDLSGPAAENG